MKTMKSLIVALGLLIGIVGVSHAASASQGQGWKVTIVTGTAGTVVVGGSGTKLRKVVLSSGTSAGLGDFIQLYTTAPNTTNGAGSGLWPVPLFVATAAVTPPIVFNTTNTVNAAGANLNNIWSLGECDDCYVEIPALGELHYRKSAEISGGANQAAIYWSK